MGLLSIIRKQKQKEKEMRFLVLGLDNAGKTTILKRLNGEDVHSISPTLGFKIYSMDYKSFHLNIWDVGGQKTIRNYWKNYFEETDAVIWVVDSGDVDRLDDCRKEFKQILFEEKLMGAAVLIFCNKCDLEGALPVEKIQEYLQLSGPEFETRYWSIVSCSAITGEGIQEGFDWLVEHTFAGMQEMENPSECT
ncbi:ADP-ribosylation factor-like protein 2 [Blastocystis sp. ATCC 50177/Nand II]|uniref:ADP-ribosylation factor-like protein 2 n=1 Tax=Blastocystis sp. subtype 1 (strain ATCC 50177 / NandII) TaxID=478820 RepID=A0A196SK19_BLAHN|nr:ADP-ribosylation factor-like protein 2 [Blastocystis sp. ATCC 50177/Nand II]